MEEKKGKKKERNYLIFLKHMEETESEKGWGVEKRQVKKKIKTSNPHRKSLGERGEE